MRGGRDAVGEVGEGLGADAAQVDGGLGRGGRVDGEFEGGGGGGAVVLGRAEDEEVWGAAGGREGVGAAGEAAGEAEERPASLAAWVRS